MSQDGVLHLSASKYNALYEDYATKIKKHCQDFAREEGLIFTYLIDSLNQLYVFVMNNSTDKLILNFRMRASSSTVYTTVEYSSQDNLDVGNLIIEYVYAQIK